MNTLLQSLQPKQIANPGAKIQWTLFSSTMISNDREPRGSS
jgi:hypothetical protein